MNKNKAVVGISGGVDSAAALITLTEQGYDVTGCYVKMLDDQDAEEARAKELCKALSVPFIAIDSSARFKTEVSDVFCRQYCEGLTPNPCVLCNPSVKFKSLSDAADSLEAEYIATGHYAKIIDKDGHYCVGISENIQKDQSYMLYALPQNILRRLLLPIGCNTKEQNRLIVKEHGLSFFSEKDSQDICFVPDGNYIGYIHSNGCYGSKGNVISPEGTVLRSHNGIEYFTVGQRKGIANNHPGPLYVKEIESSGDVITSYADGLFSSSAVIEDVIFNPLFGSLNRELLSVKVRYSSGMNDCRIISYDKNSIKVSFLRPVRAVTPGQSAVIYSGSLIVAGGIIKKAF